MTIQLGKAQDLLKTYGIGILTAPKCEASRIPLYETVNGEEPGAFITQVSKVEYNFFRMIDNNDRIVNLHASDAVSIGYEEVALTVFEENDYGFKVALNHTNGEGYWISKTDVKRYHLSHWSWMDYLTKNYVTLFPEALGIPMNLREQPNATSNKLATLDTDVYQITPTGKTDGLWAQVSVSLFSAPYCEDAVFKRKFTGWVKLLDDKGYPNLWFYAKGC